MMLDRPALPRRRRLLISVLLIGHLMAVALPPLAFQTSGPIGASPAVNTALAPVRGYGEFLYLNRGYAFFAPDPGPSHLFQVALFDPERPDAAPRETLYPNHEIGWPRLLYHRHFMLAEFLEEIYQPPGPPPELVREDPLAAEQWKVFRERYEAVRGSVVDHVKSRHPGKRVALRRLEHVIPDLITYQSESIRLDDLRLYQVQADRPVPTFEGQPASAPTVASEQSP